MANDYYTIMTQTGHTKLAETAATGAKLAITTFALGDGGGASYEPDESQADLKHEVYRSAIPDLWIEGSTLAIDATVPPEAGGWIVRELGIYDAEGDLIAIAKTPDDPKPGPDSGIAKEVIYQLYIALGNNVQGLEITIDPTVAIATKAEVQAVAAVIGNAQHYQDFADVADDYTKATALTEVIQTMVNGGVLRTEVKANDTDYPIDGLLEVIKYDASKAV